MTNGDKIRQMNDYELAAVMHAIESTVREAILELVAKQGIKVQMVTPAKEIEILGHLRFLQQEATE